MTQVLEILQTKAGHGRHLVAQGSWCSDNNVETGALWTEMAVWVTEHSQMSRLISLHHPIGFSDVDWGTVSMGQVETGSL